MTARSSFDASSSSKLADNAHLSAILRLVLRPYQDIVMYGVYTESCVAREITALIGVGPKLHIITRRRRDRRRRIANLPRKLQQEGVELISFDELKLRMLN